MRVAFLAGHLSRRASGVRQMIEGLSGAVERRGVEACVFGIRDENWARDASGWRGGPAQVLDRLGPGNFGYRSTRHTTATDRRALGRRAP